MCNGLFKDGSSFFFFFCSIILLGSIHRFLVKKIMMLYDNVLKHLVTQPNVSQMHWSLDMIKSKAKVSQLEIRGSQWTVTGVVAKAPWSINVGNLSL